MKMGVISSGFSVFSGSFKEDCYYVLCGCSCVESIWVAQCPQILLSLRQCNRFVDLVRDLMQENPQLLSTFFSISWGVWK